MAEVVRELVAKLSYEIDGSAELKKFSDGTDDAKDSAEGLEEGVDKAGVATVAFGNIIANAATRLVDFAANAAKQAVAGLKDIVFGTAEAADEIAKMSKQLGVDAEQLQRLRGAADLSGASIQDMNRGIRALTVGLADAKSKGSGPVMEGFQALGIAVEDVEALLAEGNIEGAVSMIGDAFNETGDSAEKNAALLKIFGARAGAQLRPLLESGTDGIRQMGDQIAATGEIIDNETLPTFEKMQDDLRLVQGAVTGAKNQIAGALAPTVSDIADRFNTWIAENQDFINQDLPEIMTMIAEALSEVLPLVIDVIVEFKNFYNEMKNIDERLTQDWGPAWETTKWLIFEVLNPIKLIFEFINRMIDRVDVLIGRFRTVGDVAADAARAVGMEPGGVRGSVRVGENEEQRRARLTKTKQDIADDKARIDEAMALEEQAREDIKRGIKAEIRERRQKGEALGPGDIRMMEDAGFTESEIDSAVEGSWNYVTGASGGAGKGGGGKGGGGKGRGRRGGAKSSKPEPTIDDLIAGAGSSPSARAEGGGAGPGLGGTFNTIDASYNANTTIMVEIKGADLEGLPAETQASVVANAIKRQQEARDQRIFDHYSQSFTR